MLRRGVEMLGLKAPLELAQFKPALAINPPSGEVRGQPVCAWCGRCAIRRTTPKDELDLVLFLNGIAVATAELKELHPKRPGCGGPVPPTDTRSRRAACWNRC